MYNFDIKTELHVKKKKYLIIKCVVKEESNCAQGKLTQLEGGDY